MRILSFSQYGAAKDGRLSSDVADALDDEREYVGVAIGPRSDEARVQVDGELLEAGRILPLRNRSYKISRATPYDNALSSIRYLELMLFEDLRELAVDVARPQGKYSETFTGRNTTYSFEVPYVGRRQARFVVTGAVGDTFTYSVNGRMYSDALRGVKSVLLKDGSAGQVIGATGTFSFYIGGTDNAECWDVLAVAVTIPDDASHTWTVDTATIGELGVR